MPSKIRELINRDNGRYYRAGNRNLNALEIIGYLLLVAALFLWHLHSVLGISLIWAIGSAIIGFIIAVIGDRKASSAAGT